MNAHLIKLADVGMPGHSHMLMQDKGNLQVADHLIDWLGGSVRAMNVAPSIFETLTLAVRAIITEGIVAREDHAKRRSFAGGSLELEAGIQQLTQALDDRQPDTVSALPPHGSRGT